MLFFPRKARPAFALLLVVLAVNFVAAQKVLHGNDDQRPNGFHTDSGETMPAVASPNNGTVVLGNGINYHGGPVLHGNPVPVYIIWYGDWSGTGSNTSTTITLIDDFLGANSLGNSPYEKINSTYGDAAGNVSGNLELSRQVFDSGSQGTKLTNKKLTAIVNEHLTSGSLPTNSSGVYLVLTSSNVSETGFCSQFCGFHTVQTLNGKNIKWAFIGNPDRCPSGCEIQSTGPNSPARGVGGADGMTNIIAHETEESISDPDLNAWFDSSGEENADKCNFRFGPTRTAADGAKFNQTFGGHDWMIQMNWENRSGGGCAQVLGGKFF